MAEAKVMADIKASSDPRAALEKAVLAHLATQDSISSLAYTKALGGTAEDHELLVGVLKSLQVGEYVSLTPGSIEIWTLSPEGQQCAALGSSEVRVFNAIPAGGIKRSELEAKVGKDVLAVGIAQCMKQKWVEIEKAAKPAAAPAPAAAADGKKKEKVVEDVTYKRKVASVTDTTQVAKLVNDM